MHTYGRSSFSAVRVLFILRVTSSLCFSQFFCVYLAKFQFFTASLLLRWSADGHTVYLRLFVQGMDIWLIVSPKRTLEEMPKFLCQIYQNRCFFMNVYFQPFLSDITVCYFRLQLSTTSHRKRGSNSPKVSFVRPGSVCIVCLSCLLSRYYGTGVSPWPMSKLCSFWSSLQFHSVSPASKLTSLIHLSFPRHLKNTGRWEKNDTCIGVG